MSVSFILAYLSLVYNRSLCFPQPSWRDTSLCNGKTQTVVRRTGGWDAVEKWGKRRGPSGHQAQVATFVFINPIFSFLHVHSSTRVFSRSS